MYASRDPFRMECFEILTLFAGMTLFDDIFLLDC